MKLRTTNLPNSRNHPFGGQQSNLQAFAHLLDRILVRKHLHPHLLLKVFIPSIVRHNMTLCIGHFVKSTSKLSKALEDFLQDLP